MDYEAMFKMKQDDWMQACVNIDQLIKENKNLNTRIDNLNKNITVQLDTIYSLGSKFKQKDALIRELVSALDKFIEDPNWISKDELKYADTVLKKAKDMGY